MCGKQLECVSLACMSALESFHLEAIFDTIFVVVCSVCSVIYGMSPYQQLHRTLGLGFT